MATLVTKYQQNVERRVTDFTDITASPFNMLYNQNGELVYFFDQDLTEEQINQIRNRIMSKSPVEEDIRVQAQQAVATIDAYLANTSPTTAEAVAQVEFLSRVCRALIQLQLQDIEAAGA